jgi:hypothetical protein
VNASPQVTDILQPLNIAGPVPSSITTVSSIVATAPISDALAQLIQQWVTLMAKAAGNGPFYAVDANGNNIPVPSDTASQWSWLQNWLSSIGSMPVTQSAANPIAAAQNAIAVMSNRLGLPIPSFNAAVTTPAQTTAVQKPLFNAADALTVGDIVGSAQTLIVNPLGATLADILAAETETQPPQTLNTGLRQSSVAAAY